MKRSLLLIVLTFLYSVRVGASTSSQIAQKEFYVSPDNTFSFQYPKNWSLEENNRELALTNRGTTTWSTETSRGEIRLRIVPPAWVAVYMLTDAFLSGKVAQYPGNIMELLTFQLRELYKAQYNLFLFSTAVRPGQYAERIVVGERQGYLESLPIRANERLTMLTLDLGDKTYASVSAITVQDEWALYLPTMFAIADSIASNPDQMVVPLADDLILAGDYSINGLSFDYPTQWAFQEMTQQQTSVLVIANSPWLFVNAIQIQAPLGSQQFMALLMEPYDLGLLSSSLVTSTLTDISLELARIGPGNYGAPEQLTIDGKHAEIIRGSVPNYPGIELVNFVLTIELQPEVFAAFSVASDAKYTASLEEVFKEIAGTLEYAPVD